MSKHLDHDLERVTPGMCIHAMLPSDGVTWDSTTGWSGTAGLGEASVLAIHEDGSADLEIIVQHEDPRRPAHVEKFEHVPHLSRAERIKLTHQDANGRPDSLGRQYEVYGPHWHVR